MLLAVSFFNEVSTAKLIQMNLNGYGRKCHILFAWND
jgi:hypothetical protein